MKKLITLLVAIVLGTSIFAQKNFDNEFYFRFGYSLPSWSQFGGTENDWENGWARSGWMGEVGTIFMINRAFDSEKVVLGIDVDYISVYWNRFSYQVFDESIDLGTLRVASKVGPSFTYSPVKRLAFDVYVKANIDWVTATAIVYDDNSDDTEGYGKIFSLGLSTGFNIRYSLLMIGFEFNTISPQLENVDEDGEYLGNINNPNSNKSPLPCFNFSIGLSF